jgi:hypothetical protein
VDRAAGARHKAWATFEDGNQRTAAYEFKQIGTTFRVP